MFKRSKPTQTTLFSSCDSLFSGKSLSIYDDKNSWHNQFRIQVTQRIDETIFKPLYSDETGSPNASIKVLIAMMILKEAEGLSDQKLFESCRFNMLTRSAIGLLNADAPLPTESTYYLFRKKVNAHAQTSSDNLFDLVFSSITKAQSLSFDVSGKRIRMDSKLLGSNIAWLSRYEIVHESLCLFYKQVNKQKKLDASTLEKLNNLLKIKGNKIVYSSSHSELKIKLQDLGVLIAKVLPMYSSCKNIHYQTLKRVFEEQFEILEDKRIIARNKEEISSKSVQSPHDTDAHFRNKDGNRVKGYSVNITESCDDGKSLNLIADVDLREVTTSDVDFFQDSVTDAETVFCNTAVNIHADGAYHSPLNQEFCKKNNANLHLHAIQGAKSRYELEINHNNELTVLDTKTNKLVAVTKIKTKDNIDKWRIKIEKGYRYFTQKEIDVSKIRKKIKATPIETLQKRNNVEASIFQLGYHYSNGKSRYRGLIKHQMWANMRCLWVNFVRVLNFVQKRASKAAFFQKLVLKQLFDNIIYVFRAFLKEKTVESMCFQKT